MFEDKFSQFLAKFGESRLEPMFYKHFEYGTADVYIEDDEILACVRWNVSKSGFVANILDLFIDDGVDSIKIMRWFGKQGCARFPRLKYIKFLRGKKFAEDKARIYKVSSLTRD